MLRGAGLVQNPKKNPMAEYLAEPGWNFLFALEQQLPEFFTGIVAHVSDNAPVWQAWATTTEPQQV